MLTFKVHRILIIARHHFILDCRTLASTINWSVFTKSDRASTDGGQCQTCTNFSWNECFTPYQHHHHSHSNQWNTERYLLGYKQKHLQKTTHLKPRNLSSTTIKQQALQHCLAAQFTDSNNTNTLFIESELRFISSKMGKCRSVWGSHAHHQWHPPHCRPLPFSSKFRIVSDVLVFSY